MDFINFDQIATILPLNEYGGSDRKSSIIIDHEKYLLKFPDPIRENNKMLSYINNSISEYIACKVVKSIGVPVQDVVLGTITVTGSDGSPKEKIACACKDVRQSGEQMYEIEKQMNSMAEDEQQPPRASWDGIMHYINSQQLISPDELTKFFCEQFIIDAFIGNTDRHNGNWAILSDGVHHRISPIYDCGSSLDPLVSDAELQSHNINNTILNQYSAIRNPDLSKIQYRTFLLTCTDRNLQQAIIDIVPRIDLSQIHYIIDAIPYISETRKNFYKSYLDNKYKLVLIPALEKVLYKDDIALALSDQQKIDLYNKAILPLANTSIYKKTTCHILSQDVTIRKITNKKAILFNSYGIANGVVKINREFNDIEHFLSTLLDSGYILDGYNQMPLEEALQTGIDLYQQAEQLSFNTDNFNEAAAMSDKRTDLIHAGDHAIFDAIVEAKKNHIERAVVYATLDQAHIPSGINKYFLHEMVENIYQQDSPIFHDVLKNMQHKSQTYML